LRFALLSQHRLRWSREYRTVFDAHTRVPLILYEDRPSAPQWRMAPWGAIRGSL